MDERGQRSDHLVLPPFRPPTAGRAAAMLTGGGLLLLGLIVGYAVGHASRPKDSSATISPIVTVPTNAFTVPAVSIPSTHGSAPTAPSSAPSPAQVGGSLTLTGQRAGEKMTVTLVKAVDPAQSADDFGQPDKGKHLVAVQVRLTNVGTAAYSDSPTNGARLIDGQGQQYDAEISRDTTVGKSFGGDVKLAPGAVALGVVTFMVADGEKPTTFQFSLDSGFADQTGQWRLS